MSTNNEIKCISYWWQSNLEKKSEKCLDANVKKGKTKFLAAGAIGAYQGSPNLFSAKSPFFTCAISLHGV